MIGHDPRPAQGPCRTSPSTCSAGAGRACTSSPRRSTPAPARSCATRRSCRRWRCRARCSRSPRCWSPLYHAVPQLRDPAGRLRRSYGWTPDPVGARGRCCSALAIIMVLGTALALLFSAANVFFRDFSNVVSDPDQLRALRRADDLPLQPGRRAVRRRTPCSTSANPIADAVLLMQRCFWVGTDARPPGADGGQPTCPTTSSPAASSPWSCVSSSW